MMRPIIFLTFLCLCGLIFTVFNMEQRVQDLRAELYDTNRQLKDNLDELHVLKAEWTYLTHPKRLEEISNKYLITSNASFQQIKQIEAVPLERSILVRENTTEEILVGN